MTYLPLIKKLAPYLIIAILAAGAAYKLQQLRIDKINVELAACHDANAASVSAISQMKADAAKNRNICEKTIRTTEHTIAELKRIDSLGSHSALRTPNSALKEGGTNETTDTDPLLLELNGMFKHAAR